VNASLSDNELWLGDAAAVAHSLQPGVMIDLVYVDPPYGTGESMGARLAPGEARQRPSPDRLAYSDSSDVDALVELIAGAAREIALRMRETGTFAVHLDHRAVHETKVALDGVFGRGAFLGEVIWSPGNGARGKRLAMTHQTILFYARSVAARGRTTFNAKEPRLREPYAKTSLEMHFQNLDEAGRRYREREIRGKVYRYYADEGRRMGSVWTDISAMVANTPLRAETTGYPTQKPLKLLERIIAMCSRPGDVVADLMCGSGTTLVAAENLGRRFIGGDRSRLAVDVARKRLTEANISFTERHPVNGILAHLE
jgi:site-specific DNA-methyltransferase (adenine-specific)